MTPQLSAEAPALDWDSALEEREVALSVSGAVLGALSCRPKDARAGLVLGHPSAVKHLSSRERFAAGPLARAGFATLLVDLVTDEEDWRNDGAEADIPLLALRLAAAARWLAADQGDGALPIGFLGADEAAPASLVATALEPAHVFAVVARGGHPERAGASMLLSSVPLLQITAAEGAAPAARAGRPLGGGVRQRLLVPSPDGELGAGRALDAVVNASTAWFTHWLDASAATRLALAFGRPRGHA